MIAFGYIHEDINGMLYMTKQLIGSSLDKLESAKVMDFSNNTSNDFYSYLAYKNITDYIFISNGERIIKLVEFMNSTYPIDFQLFNRKLEFISGVSSTLDIKNQIEVPNALDFEGNTDEKISFAKKELHLLLTGHYPLNLKGNLMRHLYVENIKLLNCIDISILKNCAINAIIFYDNCTTTDIPSKLFPIMINFQNEGETIELLNLINMTEEEILEAIDTFQHSGNILNNEKSYGIVDYTTIMNVDRNQRLFYFEEGIYIDYSKKILITSKLGKDFYEIVNNLSFRKSVIMTPAMRIYPMVINISALLDKKQMYIVTPFNAFVSKDYIEKHKDFEFIGMVFNDKYYLYQISNNKNYEVNKAFILLLEFYLKDKLNSKELQKYFPNKLESFKEAFSIAIESRGEVIE